MSRGRVKYFSSVEEAFAFMRREGKDWVFPHQRLALVHKRDTGKIILAIKSRNTGAEQGYVMEEAA